MKTLQKDVTIVIRSVGERTTNLCKRLVQEQVPSENIFVIEEIPFSKAVRRTFEIGLSNNLSWTVAVDADILLADQALSQALSLATQADENIFRFNGRVVDNFFGGMRFICPHIYRTSLLELALANIPDESSIRPENAVVDMMAKQFGHPWATLDCMLGVHDYEQYYRDIFRKAFVHANKFDDAMTYRFLHNWSHQAVTDDDFKVALMGLCIGLAYKGEIEIDSNKLPTNYYEYSLLSDLVEKGSLENSIFCDGEKVQEFISTIAFSKKHPTLSEIKDLIKIQSLFSVFPSIAGIVLRNLGEKMIVSKS
jgi:hypothetical protein